MFDWIIVRLVFLLVLTLASYYMQPFGLENNNEIFVAAEEPYGVITGTLRRAGV